MAKHGSVRQRRNTTSTAREIVLRDEGDLLPVPDLPPRTLTLKGGDTVPVEWHDQAKVAWVEMWQYPLIYEAPASDRHLMLVYVDLIHDYWWRAEHGKSRNEVARDLRSYAELWGIGEKSRRHLQITIQQAEEALEKGVKRATKQVESSVSEYSPNWSADDEDDGSIIDAQVVE